MHVAAVEALALGRAEPAFHLDALRVARGEIVEDGVAEDVVLRVGGRDVGALVLGDDAEFEFVIHHLAVARPFHGRVGAAHAEAVGDVVDRLLAIDLRQFAERLGIDPRQLGHRRSSRAQPDLRWPRGACRICSGNDMPSRICRGSGTGASNFDIAPASTDRLSSLPCWSNSVAGLVRARAHRRRSAQASMRRPDWHRRCGRRRPRDRTRGDLRACTMPILSLSAACDRSRVSWMSPLVFLSEIYDQKKYR